MKIKAPNHLTKAEERKILEHYKKYNDQKSLDLLVMTNYAYIVTQVNKWKSFDFDDLIGEAVIGFIDGINNYDINKYSVKLITAATKNIHWAIKLYILGNSSTVRKEILSIKVNNRIDKFIRDHQDNNSGDIPSNTEIIKKLKLTPPEIKVMGNFIGNSSSMDSYDFSFVSLYTEDVISANDDKILVDLFLPAIKNKRDIDIIRMYYGLDDGFERSIYSIADHFDMHPENARLLITKSIKSMSKYAENLTF